jgi:hypothetical protein
MINLLKKLSIVFILISCVTQTDTSDENKIKIDTSKIDKYEVNIVDSIVYTYKTKYRIIDSINVITTYDTIKVEYTEYIPEIIYEYQNKVITVYDTIFVEVPYCTKKGFLCKLLCGKK